MHPFIIRFLSFLRQPLIRVIGIFLFVALITLVAFRQVGSWLTVADTPPRRIDVVCTFGGDHQRVIYSKKLMADHPDAHWFLSDYKNGNGRLLQKNNFDMRRVSIIDTCKSTLSEINAIGSWLAYYRTTRFGHDSKQQLNVALVSSPYHMRRIKIMAQRRIKIENVKLYIMPVPLDNYLWSEDTFRYWWRSNAIISVTTLELLKLGYFILTGYF
jgi:hypothetical protein